MTKKNKQAFKLDSPLMPQMLYGFKWDKSMGEFGGVIKVNNNKFPLKRAGCNTLYRIKTSQGSKGVVDGDYIVTTLEGERYYIMDSTFNYNYTTLEDWVNTLNQEQCEEMLDILEQYQIKSEENTHG